MHISLIMYRSAKHHYQLLVLTKIVIKTEYYSRTRTHLYSRNQYFYCSLTSHCSWGDGNFCELLTIILFLGSSLPFHHFYGLRVVLCTVLKFSSSTRSYCAEVQCQIGNLSSLSVLKKETVLSALLVRVSSSNFIDPTITEFAVFPYWKHHKEQLVFHCKSWSLNVILFSTWKCKDTSSREPPEASQ